MEQMNILEYYGKTSGGFLHARGQVATDKLIDMLEINSGDRILEFGCGTGATLVRIATNFENVELIGIDRSEQMLESASKRITFSKVSDKVILHRVQALERLPYEDGTFDKVYVESVLAIQANDALQTAISEIKRLLKKDGKLIMNETLWLDHFSVQQASKINEMCSEKFGIIQANSDYGYRANWFQLFADFGFTLERSFPVDLISIHENAKYKENWRSNLLNLWGKIKRKLSFRLSKVRMENEKELAKIFGNEGKVMEGIIFEFRLTDQN